MNDPNFYLYHRSPPIKPQEGGGRSETAVQAVVSFAFLQNLPLGQSAFFCTAQCLYQGPLFCWYDDDDGGNDDEEEDNDDYDDQMIAHDHNWPSGEALQSCEVSEFGRNWAAPSDTSVWLTSLTNPPPPITSTQLHPQYQLFTLTSGVPRKVGKMMIII